MRDKQDGLRLATALAIVAAVATTACVDHSVVAPSGPRVHPTFALVPGSGATRGPLLAEAVITIPESGDASGVVPLIALGQATGPVLIEMVSAVRFSGGGTVPASEALFPGVTMYFRANGDLYLRFLSVPVFAVSPGGAISYQQPPTMSPSDSVALVDASAPAHGLQIIWATADEQFTTLNVHDPGFSGECAFDITFICQVGPAFGPSRISAGPPSGTIVVRVYAAQLAASAKVLIAKASNAMVAPQGLGQDELQLNVSVVDGSTHLPIPNRTVALALAAIEPDAGHAHGAARPAGVLSATVVSTGAGGVAHVRYRSPLVSGRVIVRGSSDQASDAVDTIAVGVSGLEALAPGASYDLIGSTTEHPDNHWGTPGMVTALGALADSCFAEYHARLEFNDMSLTLGGVFDLSGNWRPPHEQHRVGTSADLRTRTRSPEQLRFISRMWERLGGSVLDETSGDQPHYHLSF